ncbi:MAG TPA: ComEC/Rec2 family competence protein, partial [Vicinamibacterales bacterium]|nr:ComEC/Rec2 family competence protein [Vicinamibacterales bacterium]
MPHPASLVAVPLMAGACAGLQLHGISPGCFALCSAGAALMALAAGIAACADGARNECSVAVVVGALLAGASLGSDAARRAYAPPLIGWYESNATGQAVTLEGVLREDAAASPFGVSLAVDVHGIAPATGTAGDLGATAGGVRLTIGGTLAAGRIGEWRAGRIIRVTAWLRPPAVYRNRGVTDDRKALARRGIALVGSVKSADLVELVGRGPALSEAAAACRAWARARLSSAVGGWSRRSVAISAAILIGDRTGLSAEDERRLQEAGTYHVVAISGGNVAVLTLLLLGVLRLLRVPARAAAAASILLLVFYGRIAAGGASVDRAVTAACVYLAGRTIDQSGPALNVLAVAAMLGVGVRPDSVFDPGFLLSFGATLGILLGVPRHLGRHAVPRGQPAAAATVLAATIAAEVA